MGKYYDPQMLSLADPSKTDSPLKAIGDGMINVAKYHKQWMLDKIQDKLANNELDLSNINLDIAKATKDDKIAMSNLGREKAEVDLDTAKIDKDNKELKHNLDKQYAEQERQKALEQLNVNIDYTKANTSSVWQQTNERKYDFTNRQNLDNTIRYMHSLGFVPTGDPEKDYANIQGLLLQQMENENDPQKRKILSSHLGTLNQQKTKFFEMWNANAKQNNDSLGLTMQNDDLRFLKSTTQKYNITPNQIDSFINTLNNTNEKIKQEKETLLVNKDKNPNFEEQLKDLEKQEASINKTLNELSQAQTIKANLNKQSNDKSSTKKDVSQTLQTLYDFDDTIDLLNDFENFIKQNANFFNTGAIGQVTPTAIMRQIGWSDKETIQENMQKYMELINATFTKTGGNVKLKRQFDIESSILIKDPSAFGKNPSKMLAEINNLRAYATRAKTDYMRSIVNPDVINLYNSQKGTISSYENGLSNTQNNNNNNENKNWSDRKENK